MKSFKQLGVKKMNLKQINKKRQAVSPILAAILLIALAVAAGAAVFLIVLPMIQSPGELEFGDIKFSDVDANGIYDKVVFDLSNEGLDDVVVTAITIQAYDNTSSSWESITNANSSANLPLTVNSGQGEPSITIVFAEDADYTKWRIRVAFKIGDTAQDDLVSPEYSP
jgi:flagellin-like protein